MSLALSTLIYEWRRYLAAIIALALAGVLMLALGAMFIGIMQSFTATIDKSRAQLIILSPKARRWAAGRAAAAGPLPKRVVPLIYRHPDVVEVQDLPDDFGRFFGPGKPTPVDGQHHGHRHLSERRDAAGRFHRRHAARDRGALRCRHRRFGHEAAGREARRPGDAQRPDRSRRP